MGAGRQKLGYFNVTKHFRIIFIDGMADLNAKSLLSYSLLKYNVSKVKEYICRLSKPRMIKPRSK